jgi:Mn-dependent DtxR family transcriptional regulator
MHRKSSPPPSESSERVREYLEIVNSAQTKQGFAKRYDFLKKAMNEAQTERMIKYFKYNGLITGDDDKGYCLTKNGKDFLEILQKRSFLVGLLTRELSGKRIKRW